MAMERGMDFGLGVVPTHKLHYAASELPSVCPTIPVSVCLPINPPGCLSLCIIDQQPDRRDRDLLSTQQDDGITDVCGAEKRKPQRINRI